MPQQAQMAELPELAKGEQWQSHGGLLLPEPKRVKTSLSRMGHLGSDPGKSPSRSSEHCSGARPSASFAASTATCSRVEACHLSGLVACHESSIVASAAGSTGAGSESVKGQQSAIQILVSTCSNECHPLGGAAPCTRSRPPVDTRSIAILHETNGRKLQSTSDWRFCNGGHNGHANWHVFQRTGALVWAFFSGVEQQDHSEEGQPRSPDFSACSAKLSDRFGFQPVKPLGRSRPRSNCEACLVPWAQRLTQPRCILSRVTVLRPSSCVDQSPAR